MAHFEEKEIKAAIDSMDRSSTPGPDGLGPSFYRAAWPVIKHAMLRLFQAVHGHSAPLDAINRAHVVLLPKSDGILALSSFRPVSLQNCSVKTVCKALTTRLQKQISLLVMRIRPASFPVEAYWKPLSSPPSWCSVASNGKPHAGSEAGFLKVVRFYRLGGAAAGDDCPWFPRGLV
jgi:hypothetical protein